MPRYFLEIAYDGTPYHGWQIQPRVNTVQLEIENALTKLNSGNRIPTIGCGRTDTGVHARQFFLHFDIEKLPCDEEMFIFKLNRILPHSIGVYRLLEVNPKAHARFDANSRTYEYHIHYLKNPFLDNRSWNLWSPLDLDAMNIAAAHLLNHRDFAAFQKSGGNANTSICTVMKAEWVGDDERLMFTIKANRFLRNMVRAIVGTLVEVGKGRMSPDEFNAIIASLKRTEAGESVPADGLFLTNVTYPYLRDQLR
ncbi:MAG: tRNA pseudouridine(38-40) synthase TruA [Flavobacteriales bacterium]|nr:tRNA pseudouridine(38-40) synthase TruA [Flavobacteriales bacterium]